MQELVEILRGYVVRSSSIRLSHATSSGGVYIDVKSALLAHSGVLGRGLYSATSMMRRTTKNTVLAAPELGGVLVMQAILAHSDWRGIVIRKERKMHGLQDCITGRLSGQDVVFLIDDVATTGNSLLKAYKVIQERGNRVSGIFVVVDREQGARELLKEAVGLDLQSLTTLGQILDKA